MDAGQRVCGWHGCGPACVWLAWMRATACVWLAWMRASMCVAEMRFWARCGLARALARCE